MKRSEFLCQVFRRGHTRARISCAWHLDVSPLVPRTRKKFHCGNWKRVKMQPANRNKPSLARSVWQRHGYACARYCVLFFFLLSPSLYPLSRQPLLGWLFHATKVKWSSTPADHRSTTLVATRSWNTGGPDKFLNASRFTGTCSFLWTSLAAVNSFSGRLLFPMILLACYC